MWYLKICYTPNFSIRNITVKLLRAVILEQEEITNIALRTIKLQYSNTKILDKRQFISSPKTVQGHYSNSGDL